MDEAYEVYNGGLSQLLGDSLKDMVSWRDADGIVGVLVLEGDRQLDTRTRRAVSELETSILQETGVHVTTLALSEAHLDKYRGRLALLGGVKRRADEVRAAYLQRRIRTLMARAEKALVAADALMEKRLYNIAVSSAYYSAYMAAKALLLLSSGEPENARRCLGMFMDKFVKTGVVPRELATSLAMLYDAHTEAEFRLKDFQRGEASEFLKEARKFITAAKTILEGL